MYGNEYSNDEGTLYLLAGQSGSSNSRIKFYTSGTNSLILEYNGHLTPANTNTYDLVKLCIRWRYIYTNDLHLSNEGSSNDIDGSWGNWTIQEGESDLFLKNNRSGKKLSLIHI